MNCRWCRDGRGEVVLDLGEQPACDDFPLVDGDPERDARYPLRMWVCASCGLAQLMDDPGRVEQPLGIEPAAVRRQGELAVEALGELAVGRVREFGSPHGGSWLDLLMHKGMQPVSDGRAELVVDNLGLMHAADQRAALAQRAAALADGGTLLVLYHSVATILEQGQWTSLRHGHFAYYSTATLIAMLAEFGLAPATAWRFDLYGGTVLLAARHNARADDSVHEVLTAEGDTGAQAFSTLRHRVKSTVSSLQSTTAGLAAQGKSVLGYGAASRAVALLAIAGVELSGIADASVAKQGRRMPATAIPIVSPEYLIEMDPEVVLLFLPDLLDEVRAAIPGDRSWMVVE